MYRILRKILPLHFLFFFLLSAPLVVQAVSFGSLLGKDSTSTAPEFLSIEEAFQVSGDIQDDILIVKFKVTPEHYLYRHMLGFEPENIPLTRLGTATFPMGQSSFDQFMKRDVETYPEDIEIRVPINTQETHPEITVNFQGCANAGLCYPPTSVNIIPLHSTTAAKACNAEACNAKKATTAEPPPPPAPETATQPAVQPLIPATQPAPVPAENPSVPEDSFLASLLGDTSLGQVLLLFYLAGLALTFTPCVLPMIPIISVMVAKSQGSRAHNILLTASYVLAMALTYAVAGLMMGYFGASLNLQARLQSPWLLIPFAILFVGLALSMFGLFELQLPERLRDRLTQADQKSGKTRQGTLVGTALAGVFSTLLVSPCVSAPLAGALVYISSTGDMTMGGLSLFVLGLGMGTPLFIVGAGGASLLPKAGQWMDSVKAVFGVLMLGVAIWMVERLIPESVTLLLWGALAIGSAVYLGALEFTAKVSWGAFRQVLGILLFIYGVALVVGGIQGHTNPLQPLGTPAQYNNSQCSQTSLMATEFNVVSSRQELDEALVLAAQRGVPAFIDIYADWCISCKVFERDILTQPDVQQALAPFARIKLDITANSVDQRAILSRYNLFGPPAYLFYGKSGQELKSLHKNGEISMETLLSLLQKTTNQQSK